jgi:hypothetical protein
MHDIQEESHQTSLDVLVIRDYLWHLTSMRYSYFGTPGALAPDFGGLHRRIPTCTALVSLHTAALLFYITEVSARGNKIATIDE